MNEELNQVEQETTQVEQETQLEGSNTQAEGRLFTQDEVDKIINQRLSRERKKLEEVIKEHTETHLEREREVLKRELRLDARGFLEEYRIPLDVLDLLDYTDKESCVASLEKVTTAMLKALEKAVNDRLRGDGPPKGGQGVIGDNLRKAFGLQN